MPPAEVVDDVDGMLQRFPERHEINRFLIFFPTVNMDDQDDADQEQRLINEGVLPLCRICPIRPLMCRRIQDVEEEQPVPLRHDPEVSTSSAQQRERNPVNTPKHGVGMADVDNAVVSRC